MTTATTDTTLPIADIEIGDNVRHDVGDVTELAASIDNVGLLNPLTVAPTADGVRLIAGHRRLAALKLIGRKEAPVRFAAIASHVDGPNGAAAVVIGQLIENVQRQDLTPFEEAEGYQALVDAGLKQADIATKVARSRGHISKRLKLLRLPDSARDALQAGEIPLDVGFELSKVDDPEAVDAVVKAYTSGLAPGTAHQHLQAAIRDTEHAKQDRRAARKLTKAGPPAVALADKPRSAKPIEGWNGLAVDFDAHQTEPCHVIVVGRITPWAGSVDEVAHCTSPGRHAPDGDSDVKLEPTRDARGRTQAEVDEARAKAADEAAKAVEAERQRLAAITTAVGSWSDRNAALRLLALATLTAEWIEADHLATIVDVAGIEVTPVPDVDNLGPGERWDALNLWQAKVVNELVDAKPSILYRAALAMLALDAPSRYWPDPIPHVILTTLGLENEADQ